MRNSAPALLAVSALTLAACGQKTDAPAAPAPAPTAAEAAAAAEPADTRPGHVRREAQADSAQAQIEAQMQAQMEAAPPARRP